MLIWPLSKRSPELSCWNGVMVGSWIASYPLVSLSLRGSCFTDISPDLNHTGDQWQWPVFLSCLSSIFPSHFPSSLHTSLIEIFKTIMLNCKNHNLLGKKKKSPASIMVLFPFWPNGWGSESLLSFWWQTYCRCSMRTGWHRNLALAPFWDTRQEENCPIWLVKQRVYPDSLVLNAASARK